MENNLDFTPPNDQYLRKAKMTFHLIGGIFIVAVLLSLLSAFRLMSHYDILALVIGIMSLFMLLLAPVALFFIINSYRHHEDKKVQKLLYLIGILFFNALFLLFVVRIVFSIREHFFDS